MPILLTGFVPFGPVDVNPSMLVVHAIRDSGRWPDVCVEILPTAYRASEMRLRVLLEEEQPDAVLMLGVAQKRDTLCLERIALNIDDASIADNEGDLAQGREIVPGGPLALQATMPLEAMLAALRTEGLPAQISNHAGTYVCNHVMYTALHNLRSNERVIPCGFMHLPALAEQALPGIPGLPLAALVRGVEIALDVLRQHPIQTQSIL